MARLHEANEALARDREQRDQLVAERERLEIARDVHDVVRAFALRRRGPGRRGVLRGGAHGPLVPRRCRRRADRHRADRSRRARRDPSRRRRPARGRACRGLGAGARSGRHRPIVEAVRAAGVPVSATLPARVPSGVPAEVQLAAYRVVQEGLTDVLKHAGADARGEVLVEQVPGALRITVADDGVGPPHPGPDRATGWPGCESASSPRASPRRGAAPEGRVCVDRHSAARLGQHGSR